MIFSYNRTKQNTGWKLEHISNLYISILNLINFMSRKNSEGKNVWVKIQNLTISFGSSIIEF